MQTRPISYQAFALQEAKSVVREPYAWPGGYPRYLITEDGGCLCPDCVRSEFAQIARDTIQKQKSSGWCALVSDINWEDDSLHCDHCSGPIPSAYGA